MIYTPTRQGDAPSLGEKFLLEDQDDSFDELDELLERWDKRFTVNNLALTERYRKGEIVFVLVWVRGAKHFLTVFEGINPFGGLQGKHWLWDRANVGIDNCLKDVSKVHCPQDFGMSGTDWNQESVFVQNVELVDNIESICPSLVWFKPVDCPSSDGGNVVQFFDSALLESCLIGTYWEIGFVHRAVAGVSIENGEINRHNVQSGTQVVDNIPNDGRKIDRDFFGEIEFKDFCSGFRVFVTNEGLGISFGEGFMSGVQLVKVFLGPTDLYPGTLKI